MRAYLVLIQFEQRVSILKSEYIITAIPVYSQQIRVNDDTHDLILDLARGTAANLYIFSNAYIPTVRPVPMTPFTPLNEETPERGIAPVAEYFNL